MTTAGAVVERYLGDAYDEERTLIGVLEEQVADAPKGPHRHALAHHLTQTRRQADSVNRRLAELGRADDRWRTLCVGLRRSAREWRAVGTLPLQLITGGNREERDLRDTRALVAGEAGHLASYAALLEAARAAGDGRTADVARRLRDDEQHLLDVALAEVRRLTESLGGRRPEVLGPGTHGRRALVQAVSPGDGERASRIARAEAPVLAMRRPAR